MCLYTILNTFGLLGGLYSFYNYKKIEKRMEDLEKTLNEKIKKLDEIKIEIDELYKQINSFSNSNVIIIE